MAKKESFSPIEDQLTSISDSPDTSSTDLDMQDDSSDPTHVRDTGLHVTLGDSASDPLSTFPLSDNETTAELQAAEDTEQAQDPEMD
ncbi:hypothetical protein NUACC21_55780 [Scytonema sp. NUACC21]